jgi:hypothetical protein
MKSVFGALLGLSLLALGGAAAAQQGGSSGAAEAATIAQSGPDPSFQGTYAAIARGITAGEFTYNFRETGGNYQITARRRLTGIARMFMGASQDFQYSVQGAVSDGGALQPANYQHSGGTRGRIVHANFTSGDIVTTATPHMGMGHPPATPEQRRGAVDQLTAIARLMTTSGDPCSQTVKVYMDGRSRFDFVLRPAGQVSANSPAYRGRALRCSVQFRPIAGFSDPQDPATLTFLFAPTASGLYAPIVVEMPSDDVGIIRLEARSLVVNGTPLR